MYYVYLDKILCPIAPGKIQTKINNQNETMDLINGDEVNVLKSPGLTEIEFDLLLPNVRYPFATYKAGFVDAKYFLEEIEKLKTSREPFQFIVTRSLPDGRLLFDTNIKVSLESYTIKEDHKEGFDVIVSIKLKQFKSYGTKTYTIHEAEKPKVVEEVKRNVASSPAPKKQNKTYKVKSGDCLWTIAKYFYGNGSKYPVIYNANKDKISNPNLIYPGQVLTIPAI